MSNEHNKALAARAINMWQSDNSDNIEALFTPSYVNHQEPDARGGVTTNNLSEWKDIVAHYLSAFSDSQVRILDQMSENDKVITWWEISATHTKDYLTFSPTHKRVTWTGVSIDKFKDEKINESWVIWDKYRFFESLGLISLEA